MGLLLDTRVEINVYLALLLWRASQGAESMTPERHCELISRCIQALLSR